MDRVDKLTRRELENIREYLLQYALRYLAQLSYTAAHNINTQAKAYGYTLQSEYVVELADKVQRIIDQERLAEIKNNAKLTAERIVAGDDEALQDLRSRIFDEEPLPISEHLFEDSDDEDE